MDIGVNPAARSRALMADLAALDTARVMVGVQQSIDHIAIRWDDDLVSGFRALWLRDNCPCSRCRHPRALERTFMFIDHPPARIRAAAIDSQQLLTVEFTEGGELHVSQFTSGWLRAHDRSEIRAHEARWRPRLWGADMAAQVTTLAYEDYMGTDSGVRGWIEAVKLDGIALLRGVPQVSGQLLKVARRIGPVRASNFGDYYDVVSMPAPNASAYTAMALELHTDLANWRVPPDIQLLSCLKNSVSGGESVFADGFKVAADLRELDPKAYDLLSTQPIEYRFHDETSDIRAVAPVLEVDAQGRLMRIRFNNWLRGAMNVPDALIEPMYRALRVLWQLLREPKYRLNMRLAAGELIAYDNNRVLHGRSTFDASSGERHLQGCYLNQEDLDSTLRLLDRKTG